RGARPGLHGRGVRGVFRRCGRGGAGRAGRGGTTLGRGAGGPWSGVTPPRFDLNCPASWHSSSRADSLPVDRQRRVWSDEPLFAHFAPEVTRDDGRECGMVFCDAFGTAGTGDDGRRGGGGGAKLEM